MSNVDQAEIDKFSALAHRWWDPTSEFKPLHAINPLRLDWIKSISPISGKKVLDVGCGDGSLLTYLQATKNAHVYGVELADDKVLACAEKGLNVIQQNLEGGLALFEDNSFDTVVLSQTLQTIHQTARILSEIARVGKECVVSFPNFGHWRIRLQIIFAGRMPITKNLPLAWYETPNIHFCTIDDFISLCKDINAKIDHAAALDRFGIPVRTDLPRSLWNFFGEQAVFVLSRR